MSLQVTARATLGGMKLPTTTDLPVRFQKLFVSIAALFLFIYCGGVINQQVFAMQHWHDILPAWEMVATIAKVALPVALFTAGALLSSGTRWRRSMAGVLCALAGVLAQATLSYGLAFVNSSVLQSYYVVEIGGALVTMLLGMAVLVLLATKSQLRQRRYVLYSALVAVLAALQVAETVMAMRGTSGNIVEVWLPMILAHLIVLGMAVLAYFVVRGVSRADRIFRAVLTIMAAMMVTLSTSVVASAIAQLGGVLGGYIDTVYTIVGIAAPLLIYVVAVWFVRPTTRPEPIQGA